VYSNNDIKKYDKTSPLFAALPPQVSKVLLHDFQNLLQQDLCTITKYDPLDAPSGMQLFNENEEKDPNESEDENSNIHVQQQEPASLIVPVESEKIVTKDIDPLEEKLDTMPISSLHLQDTINVAKINESLRQKFDVPKQPDSVNLNPITTDKIQKTATLPTTKQMNMDTTAQLEQNSENSDNSEDETEVQKLDKSDPNFISKRKVRFTEDKK
jgi:hypothetical protein